MALGKQAKTLSPAQIRTVLRHLETTRNPERDRVMFLLSLKAGLRAKEIASLHWIMVCDGQGNLSDCLRIPDSASKGKNGGRVVPMNRELQAALQGLRDLKRVGGFVVYSERGQRMSPHTVVTWFRDLYKGLGFEGCSSHSGRRTFVTNAAKRCVEAGGSLRDVQELAGHASLQTTQRYIQGDTEAKRKLVNLL